MIYVGIDVAKDKHDCYAFNSEGKHYFVALSQISKKIVRIIYYLLKTNQTYQLQNVAYF